MENALSFGFLCMVGAACYWLFFKCIEWFDKI